MRVAFVAKPHCCVVNFCDCVLLFLVAYVHFIKVVTLNVKNTYTRTFMQVNDVGGDMPNIFIDINNSPTEYNCFVFLLKLKFVMLSSIQYMGSDRSPKKLIRVQKK